jgi:hypothetical protein
MFRLDTNIMSELRQVGDGQADARVTAWVPGAAHIEFPIHPHRRRATNSPTMDRIPERSSLTWGLAISSIWGAIPNWRRTASRICGRIKPGGRAFEERQ